MDWTQTLTIIVSLGSVLIFFIKSTKDEIQKMDINHREDIQSMDKKWERLFDKFLELQTAIAKKN